MLSNVSVLHQPCVCPHWICFFLLFCDDLKPIQPCFNACVDLDRLWDSPYFNGRSGGFVFFSSLCWVSVRDWCGIHFHRRHELYSFRTTAAMSGYSDQCSALLPGILQCHKYIKTLRAGMIHIWPWCRWPLPLSLLCRFSSYFIYILSKITHDIEWMFVRMAQSFSQPPPHFFVLFLAWMFHNNPPKSSKSLRRAGLIPLFDLSHISLRSKKANTEHVASACACRFFRGHWGAQPRNCSDVLLLCGAGGPLWVAVHVVNIEKTK